MKRILIIGGGAAGMMTAATLAECGVQAEITLIERNPRLGQKVIISGGGRCNVTTGVEDYKEVLAAYPRGARFLKTAMYSFPPSAMQEWVESHGVPLKCEDDLRVFPKSDKGTDIVRIFENLLAESKVNVMCKRVVSEVDYDGEFKVKLNTDEVLGADVLVITTGGQAYKRTGSKGDGYGFAESLNHSITNLAPSLTAFVLEEKWIKELAGVSFKNVKLKFIGKEKYDFTGPIMFTHKGVTGPGVFALSALSAFELFYREKPAQLEVDFFPNETQEALSQRLRMEMGGSPKKQFHNILGLIIPKSFSRSLCEALGVNAHKRNNEISKKELNKIIQNLKQLKLNIIGRSPGEEFVTAGGVDLSEVNSKTMESKMTENLYFGGEILNVDGFTGGYNLQAAWAAGRLIGNSIAKKND